MRGRRRLTGMMAVGVLVAFVFGVNCGNAVLAEEKKEAKKEQEISEEKKDAVAQNCVSIKQSLGQLEKVDSRTRVYLGTLYERALRNFMIPLNVRLTKNDQPNTDLTKIQATFSEKRDSFTQDFTNYMKDMEKLIGINCQDSPEEFYRALEEVREKRKAINAEAKELNGILDKQMTSVIKIRDGLK